MSAWLKRFGLHLAAAVGATGIFVAAAAVGATQTRHQVAVVSMVTTPTRPPVVQRKPTVGVGATPTPVAAGQPANQPAVDPAGQATPASLAVTGGPGNPPPAPTGAPANPDPSRPGPEQPAAQQPGAQPPPPAAPKPGAVNAPSPQPAPPAPPTSRATPLATPGAAAVVPERSLAGTIKAVLPDGLDVIGVGGREWHVVPAPGALIRLNGRAARLDSLQAGDTVVILGQAQGASAANRFLAHAITTRRK